MAKKGNLGTGTLIILISVLLVAAIAAGVLLMTQNRLQQKSFTTSSQAKGEVGTLIQIVTASATDGTDTFIDVMETVLKLSPGSTAIHLDGIMMTESTDSSSSGLTLKENGYCMNDVFTGYFTARNEDRPAKYDAFDERPHSTFSFSSSQTSEMMIGKIAIAIVFVESNGSIDGNSENWTTVEQDYLIDETMEAVNWWNSIEPRSHIRATYEIHRSIPTSYEPITRDTTMSNQTLWINEALDGIGAAAGPSTISRARVYADELRDSMNAHWGFIFFIADSSSTPFVGFPDGNAGIAYIRGPYVFIASDAYFVWTPALIAHEFGHIFGARDQYNSSACTCSDLGGYLNIETQNCEAQSCLINESSLMRGGWDTINAYNADEVDIFAKAQMGMVDTNANNLLDPIDLLFEDSEGVDVSEENLDNLNSANQLYYPDAYNAVGFFTKEYLTQGTNHRDDDLVRGDVINVCHELSRSVGEDELVRFRYIPTIGNPVPLEFITKQVISDRRVTLYP